MSSINELIAKYYDHSQFYYTHFWSRTALHYGLWYTQTKTLAEAIVNTDKLIVETLAIGAGDVVLDAGCGVGGSSIFVAETTGARVEGITLSNVQLAIARKMAQRSPATAMLTFSLQDFTRSKFPSATFTKIFGIESVCYAQAKSNFLLEANRLLRQGGRLAIIDTFRTRERLDDNDYRIYRRFIDGWAVPNLPTTSYFAKLLSDAGFKNIVYNDLTDYIWKSVERVFRVGLVTSALNIVKRRLRLARDNRSAYYQRAAFKKGITRYGMFVAEKN